jgi:hypothetical protein
MFKNLKMHSILNIGFPLYLVGFEILFRSFSNVDTSGFIGPTLAASGLGLLIGVLKPKTIEIQLDDETVKKLKAKNQTAIVRDPNDEKLVTIAWIAILIELLIWYWSCAEIMKPIPDGETASNYIPLSLGIGNYVVGIIISSFKESN